MSQNKRLKNSSLVTIQIRIGDTSSWMGILMKSTVSKLMCSKRTYKQWSQRKIDWKIIIIRKFKRKPLMLADRIWSTKNFGRSSNNGQTPNANKHNSILATFCVNVKWCLNMRQTWRGCQDLLISRTRMVKLLWILGGRSRPRWKLICSNTLRKNVTRLKKIRNCWAMTKRFLIHWWALIQQLLWMNRLQKQNKKRLLLIKFLMCLNSCWLND